MMPHFKRWPLALIALLVITPVTFAQSSAVRVVGEAEGSQTRKRLVEAQQKLTSGKHAEGATELQRIIDDSGDDLVQVTGDQFQPARRLAHLALTTLPTPALNTFRDRIEEPAKKLLEAGKKTRDPAPLQKLLSLYFTSRPAEEALLLLGELAFERGEFGAAETHWRKLLPGPATDLRYPAPKTEAATVTAKVLLANIYGGNLNKAAKEIDEFRKAHPKATGRLAGVDGDYATTLQNLLKKPPTTIRDVANSPWPTFAGSAQRLGLGPETPPFRIGSSPKWQTKIPRDPADKDNPRPAGDSAQKSLVFHPIILGEHAYIADTARVYSFHLLTGEARLAYDCRVLDSFANLEAKDLALPNKNGAAYTLSVSGGKILARLGAPQMMAGEGQKDSPRSELFALEPLNIPDLPAKALSLRVVWRLPPPLRKDETGTWEGAPLVADGHIYAAFLRIDERGKQTYSIACYTETPGNAPVWVSDVAVAESGQANSNRMRQELLTLAGTNVIFATHAGLTVAVQRQSGKPAWAFRNPTVERPAIGAHRDLCPPVYADGKVFLAPTDGEHLYAVDADDGRLLWKSAALQVQQVLGVSAGRVIATPCRMQKTTQSNGLTELRGFDINTGSDLEPEGWRITGEQVATLGRGLLTEGYVLWPTSTVLQTLRALDGSGGQASKPGIHGNLALGNGMLIAATDREVVGYSITPSKLEEKYTPPIKYVQHLNSLADSALASGRIQPAVDELRTVLNFKDVTLQAHAVAQWFRLDANAAKAIPLEAAVQNAWVNNAEGTPVRLKELLRPAKIVENEKPVARTVSVEDAVAAPALEAPLELVVVPTDGWALRRYGDASELPGLERHVPAELRHLIVTNGKQLLAYVVGGTKPAWTADVPAHGMCVSGFSTQVGSFIAHGPRGLLAVQLKDGKSLWDFQVSATDPDLGRPLATPTRVFVPFGASAVLALDISTGRVLWQRTADNRVSLRPSISETRFSPSFFATDEAVFLQRVPGQLWKLDATTGKLQQNQNLSAPDWECPPLLTEPSALLLTSSPSKLTCYSTRTGGLQWLHDPKGDASLTGRAPTFRVVAGNLLRATPRNYGVEIERLRASSGETAWRGGPRLIETDSVPLSNCDANTTHAFIPFDDKLVSVSLLDGKRRWEARLSHAGVWRVRAGRTSIVAYQEEGVPEEPLQETAQRLLRRFTEFPAVDRVVGLTGTYAEAWLDRKLKLHFLDPETGKATSQQEVPVHGPHVGVHLFGREAAVVSLGRITWLKSKS